MGQYFGLIARLPFGTIQFLVRASSDFCFAFHTVSLSLLANREFGHFQATTSYCKPHQIHVAQLWINLGTGYLIHEYII